LETGEKKYLKILCIYFAPKIHESNVDLKETNQKRRGSSRAQARSGQAARAFAPLAFRPCRGGPSLLAPLAPLFFFIFY
jgi:hypothetical protein